MHQGNLEKLGVSAWHERNEKWKMVVKGISREDFPKNCLREWSNSSSRRLTHDCFRKMIQQFTSEGSPIYLPTLDMMFSSAKTFCFENDVFLSFGLGMCEGVGKDSRNGIGHVDIQVGSCICLNVFMLTIACALRWRVTHVG